MEASVKSVLYRCQAKEPPSAQFSTENCEAEAKVPVRGAKEEVLEGREGYQGVVTIAPQGTTGLGAAPSTSKSGQSMSESQNVTNDSSDVDKKPTNQILEELETRFLQICEKDLCLDEKTSQSAVHLFRESKRLLIANIATMGIGTVEETAHLWYACVLFVVKRLSTTTSTCDGMEEDNVVGFTLSQILRATKLSLLEFFKELPQFLTKAGRELKTIYGDDWERRLMVKEVQADFYYLTVLFNYYKRVYLNLFSSEGSRGFPSGTNGGPGTSVHLRFGWMLFLALRMRVLNRFMDLVTYINGLLAVVIIMILHMPPSLRKFDFEDETFFKERTRDGRVKLVASLCARYHDASEEDVSKMVEKTSSMIGELFRKSSGLRTRSHAEQLAGIDTEGLSYFEGLMDEGSISSHLRIIEKDYEDAYFSRGELDERMFINGDENLIGAPSSGTPTISGSKRKYESMSSPNQGAMSTSVCPSSPSSPSSSPGKSISTASLSKIPPPTPVSVTMSTAKWLRTVISPLPSEPSLELQVFFKSCDQDITKDVIYRAKVLLEAIFSTNGAGKCSGVLDNTWAEQRRQEAIKLYYRVLAGMCKAESQRLGCKNLSPLLTNERFHRCMIACSAELVLYTHKTVTMTFPAVLEPTGITAFDLSKVIESFVRHEETLPRELKRHLNSMEQQILESMAWERGSSMYNALIVAKRHLAPKINALELLADPMPSLDNLNQQSRLMVESGQPGLEGTGVEGSGGPSSPQRVMGGALPPSGLPAVINGLSEQSVGFVSPTKERPSAFSAFASPAKTRPAPPLQSAFASPQRPSPLGGGETCAETVINVFIQKVLKLAAVRIKDLCERLQQSNQVWEQVYRAMQYILTKETSLFFNRHIDQLILCCIYGVCKVKRANVTFKKCIEQYGKQPQCKTHVFRNVFIDLPPGRGEGKAGCQGTGDIIKFYNENFVPATKTYLQLLGSNSMVAASNSSRNGDEDKSDNDGPVPESPRPCFPALPDMSPKKVSASHNVYVSPLRSTKMDTIMSPHTRSLYACVGESTHAYQSPSKDLTAINHVLNNRRLGRLDFNEASLVSDSLVAGSLYPCTRTANHHRVQSQSAWPMVAPLPPSPLKRPRPDR